MDFPPARRIEIGARTGVRGASIDPIGLAVHEAGEGPAVVMCHGFPELAYSWRHQVSALAEAGFRAIAPDQRGYGGSDCPEPIGAYDLEHLTSDMAGLLDALGIERAVFAGHDWGGFVAWGMPLAYPDRTLGVIGVNTPYVPFPGTAQLRAAFGSDERLYILWFQEPGVAEGVLDAQPREVFEKLMRRGARSDSSLIQQASGDGDANPFRRLAGMEPFGDALLTPAEVDTYTRAFEKTGFRGGINWYRNIDRNAELFPTIGTQRLELPCLMVTAEWDVALPPAMAANMPSVCADLEMHSIEACGHWTQQERPDELSRAMTDWLARRLKS